MTHTVRVQLTFRFHVVPRFIYTVGEIFLSHMHAVFNQPGEPESRFHRRRLTRPGAWPLIAFPAGYNRTRTVYQ
jgi:hypothetical protein